MSVQRQNFYSTRWGVYDPLLDANVLAMAMTLNALVRVMSLVRRVVIPQSGRNATISSLSSSERLWKASVRSC